MLILIFIAFLSFLSSILYNNFALFMSVRVLALGFRDPHIMCYRLDINP